VRGEDKATVEEVERMEEQHSCLRRKTRGNFAAGGGEGGQHSGWRQSSARGGREREFPEDLFVILENCRDLLVKKNLTTVLELKQKCDQNESCITFQVLQLCFRVWTPKLKIWSFILRLGLNLNFIKFLSLLR
jgi:hypothetical protein